MYKILVSDKLGQAGLDVLTAAEDAAFDLKTGLSKKDLIAILPDYDGWIVRSGTKPDADMIAAATKICLSCSDSFLNSDNFINSETTIFVWTKTSPSACQIASCGTFRISFSQS